MCAVTFSFSFSSYAKWSGYGDINCDGKVNSSDALIALTVSAGMKTLNGDEKKAADVDGNGKINSSDALYILNYSVGSIKKFPVDKGEDDSTGGKPDMGHDIYG